MITGLILVENQTSGQFGEEYTRIGMWECVDKDGLLDGFIRETTLVDVTII
jgi:hypothetical protein